MYKRRGIGYFLLTEKDEAHDGPTQMHRRKKKKMRTTIQLSFIFVLHRISYIFLRRVCICAGSAHDL